MKPMYFEIDEHLPVMVIPDADAHVDGHPVLTYSYTLYRARPELEEDEPLDMDA
ncbi:hypothetical protein [Pedobacter africanus]|uniref:Uncharacterized protein n=1 Tax=Pedobacter africanus TaxID=151894 RepID=A0A1W2AEY9_9SPHI|nr:hypothetical protein [Pedobacter africanus]SMC59236.1 hypothetical protein SAMN04488524_1360 [Pedobacter africanus]